MPAKSGGKKSAKPKAKAVAKKKFRNRPAKQSKPTTSAGQERKPPEVEVFYDVRDGQYWFRLSGRFVKLGSRDLTLHLKARGFSDLYYHEGLPETDWVRFNAQRNAQVDYAGQLAGHRCGVFTSSTGRRMLVTDEAAGVWDEMPAKPKRPTWFFRFVQELLPGEQWLFFCHWLRVYLESIRAGDFRPGQVVVLAGPAGCGKSLLQLIATEVMGGRAAAPFGYFTGKTNFNFDLAGAEHWMIEDPSSTTDIRTRREVGAKLKEATVNRDYPVHQKGKDALLMTLLRRITLSVNDEPENLCVIPPLDDSLLDKIFLLKCDIAEVGPDRAKTWATILREIPAIRAWLLGGLIPLPREHQDNRFGVRAWQHPELLQHLSDLSPEARLLMIVDHVLFEQVKPEDRDTPFFGKSIELEKALRSSSFTFTVEQLLKSPNACGTYLSRLAKKLPDRISSRKRDGATVWQILPPSQESNHE